MELAGEAPWGEAVVSAARGLPVGLRAWVTRPAVGQGRLCPSQAGDCGPSICR